MTFLKKLHIHPILILFIFLSFLTGTFVQLFILFTIILLHEIGHYVMASYYRWHIHSIVLWVFGGVMKTSDGPNRPIKEDIMVTIAGPVQHIWIFILLYCCTFFPQIPANMIQMALYYNVVLFVFNLLPIYPLDGGKLLFYILSSFLPFKRAHEITFKFSILAGCAIIVLQLIFFPFTLSAILLILFLIWENRMEWKHHMFTFIRFLLNRTQENEEQTLSVPGHLRLMEVFYLFRRNRYHYISTEDEQKGLSETDSLSLYFDKGKMTETLHELMQEKL